MADMSSADRNNLNIHMRAQPWYAQWFTSKGLDPNHVKLSDQQRAELAQVAAKNGMPLAPHLIIDSAGNQNIQHGWQGQPSWLKALEIGGAGTAAAIFGGPALLSLLGHGGGVAGGMTAADAAAAPGALSSSILGSSAAAAGNAAAAGGSVAGGLGSSLGKFLGSTQGISDAAKVLGGAGEAEANNRYKKADTTQGYDRLALSAAENRRTDESDAMKKLAIAGYLGQGGSHYQPGTIQLNGQERQLPSFSGISPLPPSEAQKAGASTLEAQMLARLQPGGSWKPTDPDYLNRGKVENIGNYGGLGLSLLGSAKDIFGF